MVGCYTVEDEFTINVRVKRDAKSPLPAPPSPTKQDYAYPTQHLSTSDRTDGSNNKVLTLKCETEDPFVSYNSCNNNESWRYPKFVFPQPVLTLVPPPNAHITAADATHFVNGVSERANLFVHGGSDKENSVKQIVCEGRRPFMGQEGNLTFAGRRGRNFGDGVAQYGNRHGYKCRDFYNNISVCYNAATLPAQRKQSQVKMMVVPMDDRQSPTFKPVSGFAPVQDPEKYVGTPFRKVESMVRSIPSYGNKIVPLKPVKGFSKPEPKPYFYTEQSSPVTPVSAGDFVPVCHALPSIKVFDDENTLVAMNRFSEPRHNEGAGRKDLVKKTDQANEMKPKGPGLLFIKPIRKHCARGSGELYVAPVDTATISASKRSATLPLKGNSRRKKGKCKKNEVAPQNIQKISQQDPYYKGESIVSKNVSNNSVMCSVQCSLRDRQINPFCNKNDYQVNPPSFENLKCFPNNQKQHENTHNMCSGNQPPKFKFNMHDDQKLESDLPHEDTSISYSDSVNLSSQSHDFEGVFSVTFTSRKKVPDNDLKSCFEIVSPSTTVSPLTTVSATVSLPSTVSSPTTYSTTGNNLKYKLTDPSDVKDYTTSIPNTEISVDYSKGESIYTNASFEDDDDTPYQVTVPFRSLECTVKLPTREQKDDLSDNNRFSARALLTEVLTTKMSVIPNANRPSPIQKSQTTSFFERRHNQVDQFQSSNSPHYKNANLSFTPCTNLSRDDPINGQRDMIKMSSADDEHKTVWPFLKKNWSLQKVKSSPSPFQILKTPELGDCVKDPSYANSGPTTLTSGGHDPRLENSTPSSVDPPGFFSSIDPPGYFSSRDLESKSETMLVTNEPVTAPHLPLTHSHFNSNNNLLNSNLKGNPRATKYIVEEPKYITEEPIVNPPPPSGFGGCENFAFDSSFGQDNPAFDTSFGYLPIGKTTSLDPGYGSDKSECDDEDDEESYSSSEEEESNSRHSFLEPPQGIQLDVEYLMKIFPFINEGTMFDVTIVKNSRGLGLALTGGIECENATLPGLIRIRKLYPQTPAWFCGQLQLNDFILEANGRQLTGLTSHEALEVLRITGGEVHMVVCRAPEEVLNGGDESPSDVKENGIISSLNAPHYIPGSHYLSPSPSVSTCGEFEIQLQKVAGSLGFTLRKNDNSILGHTIRSLVKEPAISDGRLRPGDKLLSVNGTDMCGLSHEEAVHFLRTCPETVVIRIYRDAMQTPVSPASPTEPEFTKPKALRKEARDMLTDLAFRKQSSPNLSGNPDTPNTHRRRRLNKTSSPDSKAARWESLVRKAEAGCNPSPFNYIQNNRENSPFDTTHSDTLTVSSSRSGTLVSRSSSNNSYKELSRGSSTLSPSNSSCSESRPQRPNFLDLNGSHCSSKKSQFTPPHEEFPSSPVSREYDSLDSAPPLTSAHSDTPAFSHLQSCYRSVNAASLAPFSENRLTNTASDHNISTHAKIESPHKKNALLKWKGVMFTPEEEDGQSLQAKVATIELTRGWNSRLGFSLKSSGEDTAIVAIYSDSVAAKDGRLNVGDVILEVNGNDVKNWDSQDVIELLRKTRGKIIFKVLQKGA